MIISASRRTDIPARYADWFFHRLREGFVCIRNPITPHQVSKISLSPDVVDGFVFWTKNPTPMMDRLALLESFPYYIQFTLNAYGTDLEPRIPNKNEILIPAFRSLARQLGPERLVWRYDPIILTPVCTVTYHLHYFEQIAKRLAGSTDTCVISFFDDYRHLRQTVQEFGLRAPTEVEMRELAAGMAETAQRYGFRLTTCAETIDLSEFQIEHGHCIDAVRLSEIAGFPLRTGKDSNQRPACGCAASLDIGMYQCCGNGCRYCYANHASQTVLANIRSHDPYSPLLYGTLQPEDRITERMMFSMRDGQLRMRLP